jgi:hypothetical protein
MPRQKLRCSKSRSEKNIKPSASIIHADGEIRTLSSVNMKLFKPAKEVLPPELYKELLAMNKSAKDMPRLGKPSSQ